MYLTLHSFSLKLCSATLDLKHSAMPDWMKRGAYTNKVQNNIINLSPGSHWSSPTPLVMDLVIYCCKRKRTMCGNQEQRQPAGRKETSDTGWMVMQVRSAALKPAWRNYSDLGLEATCVVWSLENLGYYLKSCPQFDLWTDHSPLAQSMKKEIRALTPRMQKFRETIQAYNVCISFVRGCQNQISDGSD